MRHFFTVLGASTALAMSIGMTVNTAHANPMPQHASYMIGSPSNFTVEMNKSQLITLTEPASAVVIGNPNVADVSVHSNNMLFLLGRGYGETNIIILNSAGQTIMNADVTVRAGSDIGNVRIHQAGVGRSSFSCQPYCLPAPILGDNSDFITAFSPQPQPQPITSAVATGASTAMPPGVVGSVVETDQRDDRVVGMKVSGSSQQQVSASPTQ